MNRDVLLHHRAGRFQEGVNYVLSEDGCWVWSGPRNGSGYGTCPQTAGERLAHRLSYASVHGPIVGMRHIHHRCENKCCVNPAHLESLTPAEHRRLHGRADSDLEWEDVNAIRELHCSGVSIFEIADGYGLGKSQIHNIVTNRKWHDPEYEPGRPAACEECGAEFVATRSHQIFCSKECRLKLNNRRDYLRKLNGRVPRKYTRRAAA